MSKKEDNELIQKAHKVVEPWGTKLYLIPRWSITLKLVDLFENSAALCKVYCINPYLKAIIEIRRDWIKQADEAEAVNVLLHELVHIFLSPITDDIEEELGKTAREWQRNNEETICDELVAVLLRMEDEEYTGIVIETGEEKSDGN